MFLQLNIVVFFSNFSVACSVTCRCLVVLFSIAQQLHVDVVQLVVTKGVALTSHVTTTSRHEGSTGVAERKVIDTTCMVHVFTSKHCGPFFSISALRLPSLTCRCLVVQFSTVQLLHVGDVTIFSRQVVVLKQMSAQKRSTCGTWFFYSKRVFLFQFRRCVFPHLCFNTAQHGSYILVTSRHFRGN